MKDLTSEDELFDLGGSREGSSLDLTLLNYCIVYHHRHQIQFFVLVYFLESVTVPHY